MRGDMRTTNAIKTPVSLPFEKLYELVLVVESTRKAKAIKCLEITPG